MYKKKNVRVSDHTPRSVAVVCGVYCRAQVKDTKYRNLKKLVTQFNSFFYNLNRERNVMASKYLPKHGTHVQPRKTDSAVDRVCDIYDKLRPGGSLQVCATCSIQ